MHSFLMINFLSYIRDIPRRNLSNIHMQEIIAWMYQKCKNVKKCKM